MAASHNENEALTLIRTKLQRPRLPGDLVPRARLTEQMQRALNRKLILISAQAGAGKTTLAALWLDQCPCPGAWLSLDRHDNDLSVFLNYMIGAIQTVFPGACGETLSLLGVSQLPPAHVFAFTLVNELADLPAPGDFVLALDDYHVITEPAVHELVSGLIEHLPQTMHVLIASRMDPPLPLPRLRAGREMLELRSNDLRFTAEEAAAFLRVTLGRDLSSETIAVLLDKTEGWIVGLRLAVLSMGALSDDEAFAERFKATSSTLIVEYLASEVLARQSPETQEFVLRTSVLERFCAPLCKALTKVSVAKSQELIEGMARANLFLVPLDGEGKWYRYHHLFGDLLRHELNQQTSAADISGLHARAGAWFARNGLIDEALHHYMTADDTAAAAALVARHRYALMNRAQWTRLDRYLHRFSPDILDQYPDLLMLKTWLLYHRGQWVELPAALQRLEWAMAQASPPPEQVDHLQGESSAVRSLLFFHGGDSESALASAQQALETTPRELWIVRILARLYLAGVLQMRGDSNQAYAAIYRGFEEEETQSDAFRASLVMTSCHIHWLDADLKGMAQAARQCIALSQKADTPQFLNYGHFHLGRVYYQQNDLAAAERCFATVVQQPYLNYGDCFANSACGLALVHQVQGRPDKAQAVMESAMTFMLETGNTSLIPLVRSCQAEIALRQGQISMAGQWADHLDPIPPFRPVYGFFWPHLTLVRTWLAQDTPGSRKQAADLLDRAREFVETTHNTRFLIEVLALQGLLKDGLGEPQTALELLEQAVTLAEPGGFIRLFVDLGPPLDRLLDRLRWQEGAKGSFAVDYITQILCAFETTEERRRTNDEGRTTKPRESSLVISPSSPSVEPLTRRELEVLELLERHLTNREIAEELVVSPSTVKTHTLNIYRKLEVNGRKQAVVKAEELGIL